MPAQRHLVDTKAECSLGHDHPQGEKATFDGRGVRNRQKPAWTFSLRSSIQSPVAIFQKKAYSSSHPTTTHDFGTGHVPAEPVFVPASPAAGEDEGWILTYVYDGDAGRQRSGDPRRRRVHGEAGGDDRATPACAVRLSRKLDLRAPVIARRGFSTIVVLMAVLARRVRRPRDPVGSREDAECRTYVGGAGGGRPSTTASTRRSPRR
jgi:hypothetical protein